MGRPPQVPPKVPDVHAQPEIASQQFLSSEQLVPQLNFERSSQQPSNAGHGGGDGGGGEKQPPEHVPPEENPSAHEQGTLASQADSSSEQLIPVFQKMLRCITPNN